jgi:adenine-specific DNA-methyltransferase
MAQLEEFQKKLWLKKKMVLQSDYCITIDRVPEELYPDILKNQKQIQEWDTLFAISKIKNETKSGLFDQEAIPYSEVFSPDGNLFSGAESKGLNFLKANPFLVLDTQLFTRELKYQLLSTIENIDEDCNGLMINSENFQALNFLSKRYSESIDYIYIDPPYNTNSTPIIYKNEYLHSSWLSLIENRNELSKKLLKNTGVKSFAIDDAEMVNLSALIENQFNNYKLSRLTIIHNPKGSITRDFNRVHEYCLFLTPEEGSGFIARKLEENEKPRKMRRWGENSLRTERR